MFIIWISKSVKIGSIHSCPSLQILKKIYRGLHLKVDDTNQYLQDSSVLKDTYSHVGFGYLNTKN